MAEESFPIVDQPMSAEQWTAVTLGIGSGILDEGGSPYWITNYDNGSNQATMRASTTTGVARSIIKGFYHKLDDVVTLDIPAVAATTTYWIALQYDPTRVTDGDLPVVLDVFTSLDRSQGKDYVILYRIVRQPNQLLTDAEVTIYRQRVAPTLTVYSRDRLPDPSTVLWGTVAVAYGPEKSVYVCMSDGASDPMRWEPVAGDAAGLVSRWDGLTYMSGYVAATHGQTPKIKRQRKSRTLRGRMARVGGGNFLTSQSGGYTVLTLPPADRPLAAQSWAVAIAGLASPSFARVEITTDGAVRIFPERDTPWVGLDGISWDVD